jgi:PIN domain nuclease of toxin-antitoxin system
LEYLMDTNVALWSLAAPKRLSKTVRQLLEDPRQNVSFSSISVVEFELKRERLLSSYGGLATEFAEQLAAQGFTAIPFTTSDATGLASVQPNRDPFDRMLSAQAIARGATLLTTDRDLLDYEPVQTVW